MDMTVQDYNVNFILKLERDVNPKKSDGKGKVKVKAID